MASNTIELVVEGNPPRKDAWLRNVAGKGRVLTTEAKDFCSRLGFAWLQLRRPKIDAGKWTMHLHIYVKLRTTVGDETFPYRDVDSSVSCVLDAMQREGALDNDIRIDSALLLRSHDPKNPRTVITLYPSVGSA